MANNQLTLAFDTETGGLNHKKYDLLTAYLCVLDSNLKLIDDIYLQLKPDNGRLPICEASALAVNKIDIKAHLADPNTITYSEGKVKLVEFLRKHFKKNGRYSNLRPLGQNVQFDIDWLQEHILPKDEWDALIHYAKVDTKAIVDFLKDCEWFPPELGNLGSIVSYLKLPQRDAHTAKDDTLMVVDVYKKIVEIMKIKKDGGQAQDLIALLESE